MFIFQFPAKNMPIMAQPKMDLTESSQVQISPGNISDTQLTQGPSDRPVDLCCSYKSLIHTFDIRF